MYRFSILTAAVRWYKNHHHNATPHNLPTTRVLPTLPIIAPACPLTKNTLTCLYALACSSSRLDELKAATSGFRDPAKPGGSSAPSAASTPRPAEGDVGHTAGRCQSRQMVIGEPRTENRLQPATRDGMSCTKEPQNSESRGVQLPRRSSRLAHSRPDPMRDRS